MINTEQFIQKAKQVHGDKYDYSKVEYVKSHSKVCIICKEHGEFWQTPNSHLSGRGCPLCGGSNKLTIDNFIRKAKQVHGDKYDYSKIEYKNSHTPICIICKEHGEFWQTPTKHLIGQGCPNCSKTLKNDTSSFIEKAKQVHGDKYDYSKVKYINTKTKVCIICPIHGEFWQTPHNHLKGKGCSQCANNIVKTTEQFIEKARQVHGDKYDYSKVEYVNAKTKVCIVCPQHGEFWQTPNHHLNGYGCSICKSSKLEIEIHRFLRDKIIFEEQKHFKWLGKLSLDFYIPSKKVAIECQGKQHFIPEGWSKTKSEKERVFKDIQKRDNKKRQLCEEHGIKILYYSNLGIVYPYEVYEDKDELLKKLI